LRQVVANPAIRLLTSAEKLMSGSDMALVDAVH